MIIDAARAEFARYGLAGARIDRIAKSANASKERLYAHFGDKEALFRQVVAADSAEFFSAIAVRPDAVAEFAGDLYDLAASKPEHLRMITWHAWKAYRWRNPNSTAARSANATPLPSSPPRRPATSTGDGSPPTSC